MKRTYFKKVEAIEMQETDSVSLNMAVCRDKETEEFTPAVDDKSNLDSGLVSGVGENFITVTVQGRHQWNGHGFPQGWLYNDPNKAGELTHIKPPGGNSFSRYFALNENEILVYRIPKRKR